MGGDVRVPERLLHGANAVAGLQPMRGEGMPQGMPHGGLDQTRRRYRFHCPLQQFFVHVDAAASRHRADQRNQALLDPSNAFPSHAEDAPSSLGFPPCDRESPPSRAASILTPGRSHETRGHDTRVCIVPSLPLRGSGCSDGAARARRFRTEERPGILGRLSP